MTADKQPMEFTLDTRLEHDCWLVGQWQSSQLLVFDNALVPWFILVPVTDVCEYYQLPSHQQTVLQEQINRLSVFLKTHCLVDKVNIATLGNVVSQLHIHVVGRFHHDAYWPDVVWGETEKTPYTPEAIMAMGEPLQAVLGTSFTGVNGAHLKSRDASHNRHNS